MSLGRACLRSTRILTLTVLAVVVPWTAAWAQNENETVGFRPNHVFESGAFGENIDILNGGLNLSIPLGQRYQVTSRLGYQVSLFYNSKVWDTSDYNGNIVSLNEQVVPTNRGTVGIGFGMHFGRIVKSPESIQDAQMDTDNNPGHIESWRWISPDGAQHEFFNGSAYTDAVHPPTVALSPTRFTRHPTNDLSYHLISGASESHCLAGLGLQTGTKCFKVETPDGLVYTLVPRVECVNPGTGPNPDYPKDKADNASYCGWYTAFIEDRTVGGPDQVTGFYPHYIRITYDARDNFKHAISQIQDSTDRITAVHNCVWEEHANPDGGDIIERCVDGTRDTDPEPIGATSRDAVATFAIDLPAFGNSATSIQPSAKATYRFYYEHLPLYRANPEHEVELEYSTLKLVRVDYPTYHHEPSGLQDEYSLYFGYSGVEDGYCGVAGGGDFGELTCRTLPLLRRSGGASIVSGNPCTQLGDFASISYRYNYYKYFGAFQVGGHSVPKRCTAAPGTCAGGGGVLSPTGVTRQLVKKHVSLPMENGQGGFNLEEGWWKYCRAHSISLTNPTEVVVTDPFENHTVYRYRASAASASQGGIDPEDGAAPEWVDGVNYEVAYYEGTAIAGRLVRTITQEHDADRMSANSHHTKENLRSRREVVRYDDDGARETVTTRNDWNDFGDWRSTSSTTVEVPEQKHVRREYKVWNAATDPYLPTLVEVEEVSDGLHVLARSDMSYDSGGRLLARVDKLTPPPFGAPHDMTQYPGDLKTLYTYSQASGNILTKNMTVGTGDIGYTMKYTYAPAVGSCIARAVALVEPSNVCGGYLASKAFLYYGVEERWKSIDRDRDANTGLIMATRDPAGIATTYDYDALGRILSIVPAGEQATSIDYASLNKTTVTQGADPNKVYTEYTYDRLGRLIASAKRPYDPALGVACQTTRYDIAGRTTFQSEWWYANPPTSCAPWQGGQAGTTFSFSEPATPNLIDPFGRVRRTVTDDDKVTSTEYFGESSRVTVNDIAGPNGVTFASTTTFYSDPFGRLVYVDSPEGTGGADALYTYDALDRLLRVDLTNGPLIAQTRRFVYDALGRLKQAENPESGTIVNLSFDALGNVTLRQDASGNIFESVYDFAGRLEAMWTNESYVVYNWYDETYGFIPNRGLGKLTTIESYNKGNWESIERRFYEGVGGRLSKTIHEFISWPPLTKAETEYQYDTRGQLISIKYPYESNSTRPRLQVDYTYANGYALSATDHAASDPPLGQVTYNAAGGVATLLTPGGGKTEMTFDSRNRPKSITIGKVGVSGWSRLDLETGDYAYDGAGNISQIGPDQWEPEHPNIHPNKFGYDAANRLISAHTQFNDGGSPAIYQESFNYDSLGNMLQHQLTANLTTTEIDTFTMPTPNRNRIASRRTTFSSSPGVNPESVTFSYDHNGNLIEGGRLWWPVDTISKQEIQRYEYGHLNRLYAVHSVGNQAASTGLSEIARFGYDASGSRIWKEEGAKHLRTVYVRDPAGQVLSEFNAIRVPGVVLPYGALTPRWTKDHVSLAGRPLAQREKLWPDPPGGLLASAMVAPAGYGKVKLGWIEEPNTQVYKVYRRYESTEYTYTHIATVSPGSQSIIYYIDPTLYPAGTALIYFVTCVDTDGHESQASATIRVIAADNVKPERPWLTAFADDGRVTLNFLSEDESGIRGYVIYRGLSSTSLSIINMQLVTDSTYVDLNLENGTTYYYQVMAQDTLGRWSDKSCEGAICPLSAVPKNYAPPSPPKDLIACSSPGKTDDVRLYWSPNPDTDGTVSYKIFRSTIPFGEGPVGGAGLATTTGTTYLDAGLEAGTYYYALTAVDDSTPPLESTWSELAAVSVRTGGPEPGERIFTQSSEGVVRLTWNVVGATPSKYILYRSLNGSSTACYQRIAEITPPVPLTMIEYVDSGAPLAAASDYVVTRLTGSSESQFSRPTLGIPLERPRQVFQCSGSDYEAAGDPVGTIVQWAPPPTARPYHPLLASTADGTFGFLQGYHMYHYAVGDDRWNPSDCNGEFKCWDDSLIRTVVEDANDPIDKYRLKYEVSQFAPWAWRDPYYPLQDSNDPTPVSPPFSGEQEMFNYLPESNMNCALPKAVYKVYADGAWLTVESDWPDHFNNGQVGPAARCLEPLADEDLPSCGTAGQAGYVPPPTNLTATALLPGEVDLEWTPPSIPPGGEPIAGYYVYAVKQGGIPAQFMEFSFRAPLPVVTLAADSTSLTVTGMSPTATGYQFRVLSFDSEGRVSPGSAVVTASPAAEVAEPGSPRGLKTILWTINDADPSRPRSRKGVKIAWEAALPVSGWSGVQGFRVYRSTMAAGPFCALLQDNPSPSPPLPNGTTLCQTTNAQSGDYTVGPAVRFYWDRSVERGRVYYYRVTQLEQDANGVVHETSFWVGDQIAGQELMHRNNVLPPPQGFKAYAPLSGPDMRGIYLRWCPMRPLDPSEDMPPITEYRIYKQGWAYRYSLFARLSPLCVATDGSGNPINRCVITDNNACITHDGIEKNEIDCPPIQPSGSCSGSDCVVFDATVACWPRPKDTLGDQADTNFSYVVTAMGANPTSESAHSNEDQGWPNYCAQNNETSCALGTCSPRRDPDGHAEYLVCGDEQVRFAPPRSSPDAGESSEGLAGYLHTPNPIAPYRVIGQAGGTVRFLFYHLDHLGSPRVIMDAAGERVGLRHFLPFGEERPAQTDPSFSAKAFTGHQRDTETGLDYMLARYYSSSLARFMAVDPGEDTQIENPQTWNKYAYVRNNPVNATDPTGQESYVCSRPLDSDVASWAADHAFIVHDATGPGQGGTVRSFGDDGTDHMGEVTTNTPGFSDTTSATDQAAWNSLGTATPAEGVACTPIPAPDPTVAAVADGVVSGTVEYSMVPEVQGGANSNSAAQAIANRASGAAGSGPVQIPGPRVTAGSSATAVSRVPFQPGTPGPQAQPPRPPTPPSRSVDTR